MRHFVRAFWVLILCGVPGSLLSQSATETTVEVIPGMLATDDESTAAADFGIERYKAEMQVSAFSIEKVLTLAVENNRSLKIYRTLEEAAQINLEQAEYSFLPNAFVRAARNESRNDDLGYVIKKQSLSSTLGMSRALETGGSVSLSLQSSTSETSISPDVTNYNTNFGLSIEHPLMRGFGVAINTWPIERAKGNAHISLLNVKQSMIDLITSIESQYWDLILVLEDEKIQKEALRRARELLAVNASLIESGRMASQEIVQAESDIATREIAVAAAENSIISRQIALQAELDLPDPIWIEPTTQMEFTPVDLDVASCLARAYRDRPDWLISTLYLDISRMDMVVARNNTRYQLNSSARIASDANTPSGLTQAAQEAFGFKGIAWNVGVSFAVPFNKAVLQNGYLLKKLAYERQQHTVQELRDNIRIQVENAVRQVYFTLRQVALARRAKELSERKLELEEEKMRVGRSTNFQVISYQRDLINAQNEELKAIANYLKALSHLQRMMGTTLERWGIEMTGRN
ncbi:TolC family protein [candidate division KSB1 bacterium]|nr:TolC family protein [candidate division KSB1 bacterium]